jgi:hypothetical protein
MRRRCPARTYDGLVSRLFGQDKRAEASGVRGTLRDWLERRPPKASAFTQTLAGVSERVRSGEGFMHAVREFLDEYTLRHTVQLRQAAIDDRPEPTGEARYDSYLGALAEHLGVVDGLARPAWACEGQRFLDAFWFPSDVPGFRALAIAESPAAFRRRGIFISRGSLERVCGGRWTATRSSELSRPLRAS